MTAAQKPRPSVIAVILRHRSFLVEREVLEGGSNGSAGSILIFHVSVSGDGVQTARRKAVTQQ